MRCDGIELNSDDKEITMVTMKHHHAGQFGRLNSSPIDELGRWCLQSWWSWAML